MARARPPKHPAPQTKKEIAQKLPPEPAAAGGAPPILALLGPNPAPEHIEEIAELGRKEAEILDALAGLLRRARAGHRP